MMIDIARPYRASDHDACLALFDSNVPGFFAKSERADFAAFLMRQSDDTAYLLIERDGRIVACGGHLIVPDGVTVGLCWGMVDRRLHRQGLGSQLMQARLDAARGVAGVRDVRLDTSQHSRPFYERFGFRVESIMPNGYGDGLDRIDMCLPL